MKTVWHWKNIGKAFLLVILAGFGVAALNLPESIGFLVGMVAGSAVMIFSMIKWDLWHIE